MVQLTAPSGITFYTDSAGLVAFSDPALMNRDVWFGVSGHGYSVNADGFGNRGRVLKTVPGGEGQIVVNRENIAERIYRITGSGIYSDTVLAGGTPPIREPLLNCGVMGQDGAMCAIYKGRIFWTWGDTGATGYPLSGNFQTTSAWSDLPETGGLDPDIGINLSYFCQGDFVKKMVRVDDNAMYWLSVLVVLPNEEGEERLVARYNKVLPPMTSVEEGYVEFDDEDEVFIPVHRDTTGTLIRPGGQAFRVTQPSGDWFYSTTAMEYARVPVSYEFVRNPEMREAFTCLQDGEAYTTTTTNKVDRTLTSSRALYSWKKSTSPVGYNEQEEMITSGQLSPEDRWFHFIDAETGKPFKPHGSSVAWNPYRNRWTLVITEIGGTSILGEIWYLEADAPEGPWTYGRKVMTHDSYSFYNPLQHPEFAKDEGRIIYFEGTYTDLFAGAPVRTPRYDYNQMMYKLDLSDERLSLPVAVYRRDDGSLVTGAGRREGAPIVDQQTIAFYAPDRPREGCVPFAISDTESAGTPQLIQLDESHSTTPLFYAFPPDKAPENDACVPLYQARNSSTGQRSWVAGKDTPDGWSRTDDPICHVWRNPALAGAASGSTN